MHRAIFQIFLPSKRNSSSTRSPWARVEFMVSFVVVVGGGCIMSTKLNVLWSRRRWRFQEVKLKIVTHDLLPACQGPSGRKCGETRLVRWWNNDINETFYVALASMNHQSIRASSKPMYRYIVWLDFVFISVVCVKDFDHFYRAYYELTLNSSYQF